MVFKLFILGIIFLRLFYLQIKGSVRYSNQSEKNRTNILVLLPKRGDIFDSNNKEISTNIPYYSIYITTTPDKNGDIQVIKRICEIANVDNVEQIISYFKNNKDRDFIVIRYLTRKQIVNLQFNLPLLPNAYISNNFLRKYKDPFAYSNIIGYVGSPTRLELKNKKYINYTDLKVGKSGLEKLYNKDLIGKVGFKTIEVDALGNKTRDVGRGV
jgi:penicillin-binding protein 2